VSQFRKDKFPVHSITRSKITYNTVKGQCFVAIFHRAVIKHCRNKPCYFSMCKRKRKSRQSTAAARRTLLLVVAPEDAQWANSCAVAASVRKVYIEVIVTTVALLWKARGQRATYHCVAICSPHGFSKGAGLMWGERQIVGDSLRQLICGFSKKTKHVHLGTCLQGCVLNQYRDLLGGFFSSSNSNFFVSGWTVAIAAVNPKELGDWLSDGCSIKRIPTPRAFHLNMCVVAK
jgi:hypothetical protein